MAGTNRFSVIENLARGQSLNESTLDKLLFNKAQIPEAKEPCIFLSHKSEDKKAVKVIGEYIKSKGVDIYLDVDDSVLQQAIRNNDHAAITKSIQLGIYASTSLMTVISEQTKDSWWVPYEIGFASSKDKALATLKLKDVTYMPSFLVITRQLKGSQSLDRYINEVKGLNRASDQHQMRIIENSYHNLSFFLSATE